ncbi:MAG TPA: carboxypeptidase-like regulatory domain-containing protein [bacterium]|nr:carboxypeptidase-like regulatory domain-containing protein [bacterium]HMW33052.1 carboxypeptidase-like regulatory domain-containing protein [bacterium]HMW36019.1 carboxypeptidase-like regulatory domain-containing protein [bacterium]HMY35554.1 carboxypeptidase-like regulatory domain-containing protein [bacterium]HMZ04928.1 carboxypeptidase-like regulatory domain-containing protein [bacterium]
MSLLHFLRAAFFSAVFSSVAFAGDFGELIVRITTKDGSPVAGSRIALAQTPYSAVTNEEGTVRFYLLQSGVYALHLADETDTSAEPVNVYISGDYPTEIDLTLENGKLEIYRGQSNPETMVQKYFSHTVRLKTAQTQPKLRLCKTDVMPRDLFSICRVRFIPTFLTMRLNARS